MQVSWLPVPCKNMYFKLLLNLKTQCISVLQQKNISVTRPLEVVKERNETTGEESDCASPELQGHLLYLSSKSFLWNAQPSILVKPDLKLLEDFDFQQLIQIEKNLSSVLFHLLAWLGRQYPVLKHLSSVRSPTAQGLGRKASDAGLGSGFASWLCDLQQVTELQLTVLICKIWIIITVISQGCWRTTRVDSR